ncbi:hypothetical protein P691DRAFT_351886 [Macrolepiota fuliginosa MF-IS2]|uniref:Uncharacterized protein n=1 Tax=Macrolepiota fuliginosa MF-IS2 TaxID=1400762 RepID=A0A9P6C7P2_9AGAR|nr:hypothetical protein P691DRAFT_351886 [Macrolepiota fuliginosa MF-IS2]
MGCKGTDPLSGYVALISPTRAGFVHCNRATTISHRSDMPMETGYHDLGLQGPLLGDIPRMEPHYFACGGLADVYRGKWTQQPNNKIIPIAIKLFRRCAWNDKAGWRICLQYRI